MFVVMIIKTLLCGRLFLSDAAALRRDVRLLLMSALNFPNVTFYQLSGEVANLYLMLSTFSPPQKPESVSQTGGSDAVAPQREAAEDSQEAPVDAGFRPNTDSTPGAWSRFIQLQNHHRRRHSRLATLASVAS